MSGYEAKFLVQITEARRVAKAVLAKEDPGKVQGRQESVSQLGRIYADMVALCIVRRIEEAIEKPDLAPKDLALLLEALRRHAKELKHPGKGKAKPKGKEKNKEKPDEPETPPTPEEETPPDFEAVDKELDLEEEEEETE